MSLDRRSYTSGHFELAIDGHLTNTAYLRSLEGGFVTAATIDEAVGSESVRVKRIATVDVEPFTFEMSMASSKDVLKWIANSWEKKFMRRNGQITHADFDLKNQFEHHFNEALVVETTFPTLDGASKDAAYLKMKIQPETVKTVQGNNSGIGPGSVGTKFKEWTANSFRFVIDGLDEMQYVNKVESFTIKQGIKKHYSGRNRFPEIEPTKIEFPTISGTIALEYGRGLMQWHDEYVVQGKQSSQQKKTGGIEFMSQDRKTVLFRINFDKIGIHKVAIEASKANAESIKRLQFELYVESMKMDYDAGIES